MTNLFCRIPFTHVTIQDVARNAPAKVCCYVPIRIGRFADQSMDEMWNGLPARMIRASILDGSFRACEPRCPWLTSKSFPVQRVEDVTDPEMRTVIDGKMTKLPWGPREVNADWDTSCNLACPTCRSEKIVQIGRKTEILDLQRKVEVELGPDTRTLVVTGSGDPFGSPFFSRWLRSFDVARWPRLERLTLHTNAQLWTEATWSAIPAAARALVSSAEISIDATTPEVYAVNRRGGSFAKLLENLELVRRLRDEGPLRHLKLSMVVQENNFRQMPDFVDLGRRFAADHVLFTILSDWGSMPPSELVARQVHLPTHPRHGELLTVLRDERLRDPIVRIGSLADLV